MQSYQNWHISVGKMLQNNLLLKHLSPLNMYVQNWAKQFDIL